MKFKIDYTNYKYHDLTGKRFIGKDINCRVSIWEFECVCGKTVNLRGTHVAGGYARKHCGCKDKSPDRAPLNTLFSKYKDSAKERHYSFLLTLNDFETLTKQNCYYCEAVPSLKITRKDFRGEYIYNGIDRKNNSIGYEINNCVACCKICNIAKASLTIAEFKNWVNKIYHNIQSKDL